MFSVIALTEKEQNRKTAKSWLSSREQIIGWKRPSLRDNWAVIRLGTQGITFFSGCLSIQPDCCWNEIFLKLPTQPRRRKEAEIFNFGHNGDSFPAKKEPETDSTVRSSVLPKKKWNSKFWGIVEFSNVRNVQNVLKAFWTRFDLIKRKIITLTSCMNKIMRTYCGIRDSSVDPQLSVTASNPETSQLVKMQEINVENLFGLYHT